MEAARDAALASDAELIKKAAFRAWKAGPSTVINNFNFPAPPSKRLLTDFLVCSRHGATASEVVFSKPKTPPNY